MNLLIDSDDLVLSPVTLGYINDVATPLWRPIDEWDKEITTLAAVFHNEKTGDYYIEKAGRRGGPEWCRRNFTRFCELPED